MKKGVGLLEFLEKAHEAGLLPKSQDDNYYSDNYDFDAHKKCLEVLAARFGNVSFESLVELCICGLGLDFTDQDDIKIFLQGVEQGSWLEKNKQRKGENKQ